MPAALEGTRRCGCVLRAGVTRDVCRLCSLTRLRVSLICTDYMWDDHDYGPNDSDRFSPARDAALSSYRDVVPHFPLPGAFSLAAAVFPCYWRLYTTREEFGEEIALVG